MGNKRRFARNSEYLSSADWQSMMEFGESRHMLLTEWFKEEACESVKLPEGAQPVAVKVLFTTSRSVCVELSGCGK